jgi:hypothetical protein
MEHIMEQTIAVAFITSGSKLKNYDLSHTIDLGRMISLLTLNTSFYGGDSMRRVLFSGI